MRKIYSLVLLLGVLFASQLMRAHDFTDGTLYYSIISEEDRTVGVVMKDGDMNIWGSSDYLTASYVSVPETVTNGGISYTVTTLGYAAFAYCSSITQIDLPATLQEMCSSVFQGCTNLKSVNIPAGVTSIYDDAFWYSSISAIYADSDNEFFAASAGILFSKDKRTLVCYPPAKTTYTNYTIPSTVTCIGGYAFLGNQTLQTVNVPGSVEEIGGYAFQDCSNLSEVILNDGLRNICGGAFYNTNISSISIPSTVWNIDGYTFSNCPNLTSINVEGGDYYSSSNGVLFTKDKTQLIRYPEGKSATSYTVPSSVTTIGVWAFHNCESLTELSLPEGLQTIEWDVFWNCSNLTSINIPSTVTQIGSYAFEGCQSLTDLTLPDGLQTIGYNAFWNCYNLTSLTLPEGLQTIGDWAFESCYNLTSINIPSTVTQIGGYAFYNCDALRIIDMRVKELPELGSNLFDAVDNLSLISIVVEPELYDYFANNEPWSQMNVSDIVDYTLGDINYDREVNVGDLFCVASHILGNMPETFVFRAADLNSNGVIEAADYVGVTNIILGTYSPSHIRGVSDDSDSNELSAEFTSQGLSISLQNETSFTAAQMDINLPKGIRISGIQRTDRLAAGHGVAFRQLADGMWRILLTSAQNDLIQFQDGELFTITLSAQDDRLMDGEEVSIQNIRFVETDMTSHMLDDITIGGNDATAVGAVTVDRNNGTGTYTLSGARVAETANMKSGIYIVNGKKVVK